MTLTDAPVDSSSTTPRPRPVLAAVATIGLVGVFLTAYVLGHDAGGRSLPARTASASSPVTAPGDSSTPSTGFTPPTELTPPTGPSSGSTFPGFFFILTDAELGGQGCEGEITFTWTFDPAKLPAAGSDAVIAVTGPSSSDTLHASPESGALKVTVPVSLEEPGEWTAVVESVDGQPADPQPISMAIAGNCF
jgi:hypothetical protein